MSNVTIDANGTAHNGKGLAKGGGEFVTAPTNEPKAQLGSPSLTVPERPTPDGDWDRARTAKVKLQRQARVMAQQIMAENPEFAAVLREEMETAVRNNTAMYPEITVTVHEETDDEVAYAELTCPWCGNSGTEGAFYDVDVAERHNHVVELDEDGGGVSLSTAGDGDFHGTHTVCASCINSVKFPENVEVGHD